MQGGAGAANVVSDSILKTGEALTNPITPTTSNKNAKREDSMTTMAAEATCECGDLRHHKKRCIPP